MMVKKATSVLSWVVPLAVMVALGLMLSVVLIRLDVGATERDAQQAEIVGLQAGMDEANTRLEALGEAPVPVPSASAGADPAVVPIAPSQAQILSAFDVWCDLRSCHGSDGEDGDDAPPMTRQQIFAGFSEWCSTDPRCVGKTGADGAAGTDGAQGRPPTPEEVLAAVDVVCKSGDVCRGPAGKDGTNGTDGADGRGISDIVCHTTGDWIITLTDGTALTVDGPCRVTQPTPTPTPTPTASITKGR